MNALHDLSPEVSAVWAKSDRKSAAWMPLVQHCADTAEVARLYWTDHMAPSNRHVVERCLAEFGPTAAIESLARRLSVFLAAGHDIGKASPAFAVQVPALADRMRQVGFTFPTTVTDSERRSMPHSTVSYLHLENWLKRKFDLRTTARAKTLAIILGGHHGVYPSLGQGDIRSRLAGPDQIWIDTRDALLDAALKTSGLSEDELRWLATEGLDQPSQLVLTAFVIVCDWIASNADFFPYVTDLTPEQRARRALVELSLPEPWHPVPPDNDIRLFEERFDLPENADIRPAQRAAMRIAREMSRPGLIIIEAPTGEGKTEAAFSAAEILAAKFGCGGALIALPTQATSNAMFTRAQHWLQKSVPNTDAASIALCHGKAQFNDEFQRLREPKITSVHDEDGYRVSQSGLRAHWWLSGRKKAALADFVVGTIDQVLLSALTSRHLMLRHLGMAGKVVILDEVHAADQYMSVYLDRALEWLGALGVPVIALSATLPPARRAEMLSAYQNGRGDQRDDREHTAEMAREAAGYPLLTTTDLASPPRPTPPSERTRATRVTMLDEDPQSLTAQILESVEEGGCVAVIHNTVDRAQQTYRLLKPALGGDVVLLHSRFIATDRLAKEGHLVELLGPGGSHRPKRLVVVSTQVLEQSLDLDFDAMFTDMAPIDALIQRMGRLHRHDRPPETRPVAMREARVTITGFAHRDGAAPEFVEGSQRVYGQSLLLRSMAVLESHLAKHQGLASPDDVAPLVREAYDPGLSVPVGWEDKWTAAEMKAELDLKDLRKRATQGCVEPPSHAKAPLLGWAVLQAPEKDEESAIQAVRDTANTIEAVVVVRGRDGRIRSLPWLDEYGNEQIDLGTQIRPSLARAVARCTVKLPSWMAQGSLGDRIVSALEEDGFATWQESPWLKGELPLILDEDLTRELDNYTLLYDHELGLLVTKGSQE